MHVIKTSKIALGNVSKTINEMFADPQRDELKFWRLVEDYVGKILNNKGLQQDDLGEVTQDCLIEIWKSISKVRVNPKFGDAAGGYGPSWKGNSSFSRWISGLVSRRLANFRRERAKEKDIPISQLGTWNDDEFEATDLEDLPRSTAAVPFKDYLDTSEDEERWRRSDAINASLDKLSDLLDARDKQILALLREGASGGSIDRKLGLKRDTALTRPKVWRTLARKHGIEVAL